MTSPTKLEPRNILKIYELIMKEYDNYLDDAASVINTLKTISDAENLLMEFTNNRLPGLAIDECQKFEELSAIEISNIIKTVLIAASVSANNRLALELPESAKEYVDAFKKEYDAALRIELFRHFFGKGQDIEEIKSKFKASNPSEILDVSSLATFLFNDIVSIIQAELSDFENKIKTMCPEELPALEQLNSELTSIVGEFHQNIDLILKASNGSDAEKIKAYQDAALDFQIAAGQVLRSVKIGNESHISWKPFLSNLFLLVSVVGTIPALVSMISKTVTGNYKFFDKTIVRNTTADEIAPEDQLLGTPNIQ